MGLLLLVKVGRYLAKILMTWLELAVLASLGLINEIDTIAYMVYSTLFSCRVASLKETNGNASSAYIH